MGEILQVFSQECLRKILWCYGWMFAARNVVVAWLGHTRVMVACTTTRQPSTTHTALKSTTQAAAMANQPVPVNHRWAVGARHRKEEAAVNDTVVMRLPYRQPTTGQLVNGSNVMKRRKYE
jgi:hypothetical protein